MIGLLQGAYAFGWVPPDSRASPGVSSRLRVFGATGEKKYLPYLSWRISYHLVRGLPIRGIAPQRGSHSLHRRWPHGVPWRLLLIGVRHLEHRRLSPRTPGNLHANGQIVRAEPAGDRERRRVGQIKWARQEKGQPRGCFLAGDWRVILDRLGRLARGGCDQNIVYLQGRKHFAPEEFPQLLGFVVVCAGENASCYQTNTVIVTVVVEPGVHPLPVVHGRLGTQQDR